MLTHLVPNFTFCLSCHGPQFKYCSSLSVLHRLLKDYPVHGRLGDPSKIGAKFIHRMWGSLPSHSLPKRYGWEVAKSIPWFFRPERLLIFYCSFISFPCLVHTAACPHSESLKNDQLTPYTFPFFQMSPPLKI